MKPSTSKNRRAFALVLVLIALVLASSMAVFFLTSVARERLGVSLYATGSEVHHLAGMPVSRIIGQINAATKEGTLADPVSWASQPGMIRTFSADGNLKSIYKLYSWDNTVEHTTTFDLSASKETPPGNWLDNPATYVDINEPINNVYPIVDPDATTQVEGFTIKSDPAITGSGLPAPMPVKWLYVLKNGILVSPTGASGSTVQVDGATKENPIIGRVAYWTDDETCKVNINTASEGAYWDWPKAATYDEMQFAGNPPVAGEFNRLPGHPAMNSLSSVFREMAPGNLWANVSDYRLKLRTILDLSPRVRYDDNSSRGGTYPVDKQDFRYGPAAGVVNSDALGNTPPTDPLVLKTDRLYVSPDEVVFKPDRNAQSGVLAKMVEQRQFFLTSQSRAPETTLFETPRVSLWPITWPWDSAYYKLPNRQTALFETQAPDSTVISKNKWMRPEERLLAFAAALNHLRPDEGDRYYFQRQNSESPTYDYSSIQRNKELLGYLQHYTGKAIPGYAGSFSSKYGAYVRDSILVNTFNGLRSYANQYTLDSDGRMLYSFTPVSFSRFRRKDNKVTTTTYSETNAFSSVPMRINLGNGDVYAVSEFPVLKEVSLTFYATKRRVPTYNGSGLGGTYNPFNWTHLININHVGYPIGSQTEKMRAVLMLDFKNSASTFWVKLKKGNMTAAGKSLNISNDTVTRMDYYSTKSPSYAKPLYRNGTSTPKTLNNASTGKDNYAFISDEVDVSPTATEFDFNAGSPITVEVYGIKDGNLDTNSTTDSNLLIGSYTVDFSGWNSTPLAIPLAPRWTWTDQKIASNECPNPRFGSSALGTGLVTDWAAIEIARLYRDSDIAGDPAVGGPDDNSISLAAHFPTNADGSVTYPLDSSWTMAGYPQTYAYNNNGKSWISYDDRLSSDATVFKTLAGKVKGGNMFNEGFPLMTPFDTVISVLADPKGPGDGDPRQGRNFVFIPVTDSNIQGTTGLTLRQVVPVDTRTYFRKNRQWHTMSRSATGYNTRQFFTLLGKDLAPKGIAMYGGTSNPYGWLGKIGNTDDDGDAAGVYSITTFGAVPPKASVGDWTSAPGNKPDGGAIVRPDQDFQFLSSLDATNSYSHKTPYFRGTLASTEAADGNFSPNRQLPSPVTLMGSVPTHATKGWQTLAFSPNPAAGSTHPGLADPPDHLLLDLFWMPVAEPYPISDTLSTAGKTNLNYRIMPFDYIRRRTALHALLKSNRITALTNTGPMVENYKAHYYMGAGTSDKSVSPGDTKTRYPIEINETLNLFDSTVFDAGDAFRSASQLCEMWLVPEGQTATNVKSFWDNKLLTSDTGREAPYEHLYSRVTTKSNTYTVHWRVQSLRKTPDSDPATWDESRDRSASELRGSTLIERYIDSNATNIPDYADPTVMAAATTQNLAHYYKWRTVAENYFQP